MISYLWSSLSPFPVPTEGGNYGFLGRLEGPVCRSLPHRLIKQTQRPQGAKTEDIANTEGKHKKLLFCPKAMVILIKRAIQKGCCQGD